MYPNVYLMTRPQVGYDTRSGILWFFGQNNQQTDQTKQFEPYPMLGVEGVQAAKVDTEGLLRVFVCAVVPDPKDSSVNWAVTVRFLCDEEFSPADRAVFRQVTDSITFAKN